MFLDMRISVMTTIHGSFLVLQIDHVMLYFRDNKSFIV
jgi:hypothetical protein